MFSRLVNVVVERDGNIPKGEKGKIKEKINSSMENLLNNLEKYRDKISFAFALYLSSWNIERFKTYFFRKKDEFSFENFFNSLNKTFIEDENFLASLRELRSFHLLRDEVKWDLIKKVYEKLHQEIKNLGIKEQDEAVSTIKIMHIIAPFYIPLLDNPIAMALRREKVCEFFSYKWIGKQKRIKIDQDSFIEYMKWIKGKFSFFSSAIFSLEAAKCKSFLKLLDQAFYIRYSIDIGRRLK